MSTASHRKVVDRPVRIPRIPWGFVLTGAALAALVAGLLVTLAMVTAPSAKAGTGYLKPAVTAVRAVTPWQRVLRHCKVIGCTSHVPAGMARDMGIKPGQEYRVHFGDTTYVWVRLPHGRVRTITS